MNQHMSGAAQMAVAMIISGTIGWFVVVAGLPAVDVVFWRCVFGAVTLLVICATLGHLRRDVISLQNAGLAALGGVAIVLNWLLLFSAYQHASISVSTVVYNTQPFMLIALGAVLFKEKPTLNAMIWLGVAFAGMLMIVQGKPASGRAGGDYLFGILLALSAAFFYAIGTLVARRLKGIPPFVIVLVQVIVGTLMLAPFAGSQSQAFSANTWMALTTLGAVHTGIMFVLLYSAVQKLPTTHVGALSFIYPVVAVIVDVVAFGQKLQPLQLFGGAAILVAAAGTTLGLQIWRSPFAKPAVLK
ncbi:MAG: DMT family transporter [Beijerinckiaceae bacterium]